MIEMKKLHDDVELPHYKRPGDAGMDLACREDHTLVPGEQHIFKLGFAMAIPEGTVALIWDRSGLAAKHGITCLAGVIDHTYRGEIGVVLMNVSNTPYEIKKGDRIAQMLLQHVHSVEVKEVQELSDSVRGEAGFGSSGR